MQPIVMRHRGAAMTQPEHFVFLLVDDLTHMAFGCAVDPLRIANLVSGQALYRWSLASENGKTATCSNGTVTLVDHGLEDLPRADRLFLLSGIGAERYASRPLINALRRQARGGVKVGGLCSAAWILARAGMLDGMRAAIHWDFHDSFMEEFPDVNLQRSVFVADEPVVTASGGTATADLMLHLIEARHGSDLATEVADQMVYNTVRDGSAEQRLSVQARHGMRNTHLTYAIRRMSETVESPLSPAAIAREIGISTRQLERLFGRHLNCSPKKYQMDIRLHKARHLLLQTEMTITEIAFASGFKSSGHFSRAYRAHFGDNPGKQRGRIA